MMATLTETTKLWNKTLARVKDILKDNNSFDYFLSGTYIYEIKEDTIVVAVDGPTRKSVIEGKYLKLLQDVVSDFVEEVYKISIVTEEEIKNKPVKAPVNKTVVQDSQDDNTTFFADAVIKPELTFNNFVVGEFNKDAHKAALYVAKNGGMMFNPLFIYSHSGLGKTHLLHAIGNEIKASRMPDAKILYITANNFVEEYIKYVKAEKNRQTLKDFFKGVDVLLLDDVQFLSGKVNTEEMFFYVYQDMINAGKRIIITSDRQPNELKGIEDRLITRFTQGLTVKINEPDIDTSVEILKTKLIQNGLDIEKFDANVIYFVAEKFSRDVRELEGAVQTLAFYLIDEEKVTMDAAIKAISSIKGGKNIANQLSEQKIINTVADYYNLSPSQITGQVRTGQISLARHISMYLIRKHLDVPLKKIGMMFGGKDHTTVMNGIAKVDKELKTNEQLQKAIAELEERLKQ